MIWLIDLLFSTFTLRGIDMVFWVALLVVIGAFCARWNKRD